jgi:3-methyladenine DNA glycosylase AlkD
MSPLRALKSQIRKAASPERARINKWFFRTAPGEYGAGDRFLGVTVPQLRVFARTYRDLPLRDVEQLLQSPWHEERLLALLILVRRHAGADAGDRRAIHRLYLRNSRRINNWDLVDSSAPQIVGAHLAQGDRSILRRLARSTSLWERRMAIVATQHFIRQGDFDDALRIAALLVHDDHDLIHKAVGWMLREIGNRSRAAEERFLRRHAHEMPRTMLRYAIEKFPESKRQQYLNR